MGSWAGRLSRQLGIGEGSIIGGRITLALDPAALRKLAVGKRIVLVSGTNGKTTTSHLVAAALRTAGRVAHNATGSNMADGAVAALAADRTARYAVLEVDELHVAAVAEAVEPEVIVLLNLSRDQLDRGTEVRAVAAALSAALIRNPSTTVVANADDPMVVWAATQARETVWVAAGSDWKGDAGCCPRCSEILDTTPRRWRCRCGLSRPTPQWRLDHTTQASSTPAVVSTDHAPVPIKLRLPGRFNVGNAIVALAAAAVLGIDPAPAAAAFQEVETIGSRYALLSHGQHRLRLLLAKNPAGWTQTLPLLDQESALLLVVNAREADGRDTSWLWDVPFERLNRAGATPGVAVRVVASGERAADLGLRLDYAGVPHTTVSDPVAALSQLPNGPVDVVANYTAFLAFSRRIGQSPR
ncbi:MAG: DUF1727 domain-containing protein [Pseudonocardia sp.]|nr:DUF1727 domain-containing protein [Pseudonocardia sp.]